jgi:hypothetical protein
MTPSTVLRTRLRDRPREIRPLPKASHFDVASKLLRGIAEGFAEWNEKFYRTKKLKDFPFAYNELQNQSIIFWAISSIPGALPFAEHQYQWRHYRKEPENRRLDFWVLYHNTVFLIEYKHKVVWFKKRINKGDDKESTPFYASHIGDAATGWGKSIERLDRFRTNTKEVKELIRELSAWDENKRPAITVALTVIPIYQESKTKRKLITVDNDKGLTKTASTIYSQFRQEPNWICAWPLRRSNFPLVFFFANVAKC